MEQQLAVRMSRNLTRLLQQRYNMHIQTNSAVNCKICRAAVQTFLLHFLQTAHSLQTTATDDSVTICKRDGCTSVTICKRDGCKHDGCTSVMDIVATVQQTF